MAADNLPTEFEVIILGTGLATSIIAAACSRVGQKVLHLDRRNYYAGNWASFSFNGLLSWIGEYKTQQEIPIIKSDQVWSDKIEDGEEVIFLNSLDNSISNLEVFSYASEECEDEVQIKAPLINNLSKAPEEMNGHHTESQDIDSVSSCTQGEAGIQNLEWNEQTPKCEDPSQLEKGKNDQQPMLLSPEQAPGVTMKITYAKLLKEGRRFNIDLVSKLLYSRGLLVDLLIKSNVSRYAEFKNISCILTYHNGKIKRVPCSRADVFASKHLTVVEKRMLMKFLNFCLDFEQQEDFQDFTEMPFLEFLKSKNLTENLQHFILHSIAMVSQDAPTSNGLKAMQHFLHCLGRYGNTPFLFPLYGLGEIPQCFCRMCAVYGGIYCLSHSLHCLVLDKESGKCKAVIDTHGQRISCSHFVLEDQYIRDEQRMQTTYKQMSRAVVITDRSISPTESDQQLITVAISCGDMTTNGRSSSILLVTVPPLEPSSPAVRLVELSSSTMTCMPGTYLIHLTCSSSGSAHEDLAPVVSRLFHVPSSYKDESVQGSEENKKPFVLWVMYFNMRDTSGLTSSSYNLPSNVHVCTGPDDRLDSDCSIKLAELVFHQLLPDKEFCPPAPNPEDIIYDADQGEVAVFENEIPKEGTVIEGEDGPQENKQQACSSEPAESTDC